MQTAMLERSLPFITCAACAPVRGDGVISLLCSSLGRLGKITYSSPCELRENSTEEMDLGEPVHSPLFITLPKPSVGRTEQDHDEVRRQCIWAMIIGFTAPLFAAYVFVGL